MSSLREDMPFFHHMIFRRAWLTIALAIGSTLALVAIRESITGNSPWHEFTRLVVIMSVFLPAIAAAVVIGCRSHAWATAGRSFGVCMRAWGWKITVIRLAIPALVMFAIGIWGIPDGSSQAGEIGPMRAVGMCWSMSFMVVSVFALLFPVGILIDVAVNQFGQSDECEQSTR